MSYFEDAKRAVAAKKPSAEFKIGAREQRDIDNGERTKQKKLRENAAAQFEKTELALRLLSEYGFIDCNVLGPYERPQEAIYKDGPREAGYYELCTDEDSDGGIVVDWQGKVSGDSKQLLTNVMERLAGRYQSDAANTARLEEADKLITGILDQPDSSLTGFLYSNGDKLRLGRHLQQRPYSET